MLQTCLIWSRDHRVGAGKDTHWLKYFRNDFSCLPEISKDEVVTSHSLLHRKMNGIPITAVNATMAQSSVIGISFITLCNGLWYVCKYTVKLQTTCRAIPFSARQDKSFFNVSTFFEYMSIPAVGLYGKKKNLVIHMKHLHLSRVHLIIFHSPKVMIFESSITELLLWNLLLFILWSLVFSPFFLCALSKSIIEPMKS